jgi:hypothetical protein
MIVSARVTKLVYERKLAKTVISKRSEKSVIVINIEVTDFSLRSRRRASPWENDKKVLFRSNANWTAY